MNATRILLISNAPFSARNSPGSHRQFLSHRSDELHSGSSGPVVALRLSLFNRWTAGVGNFTETVRLIAPDQTTVLRKGEVKFGLKDATLNATNVTFSARSNSRLPAPTTSKSLWTTS